MSNRKTISEFALILFLLSLFLLFSSLAFAAIPNSLTLQGKLTNKAGTPQQSTFTMQFRIYGSPNYSIYTVTENITVLNQSGGNYYNVSANVSYANYTDILWEQNRSVATDANGVYDVRLDDINLSFSDQLYLGIAVANDNESVPRINLSAAPYSFRSNTSELINPNQSQVVANLNVTGNLSVNKTVLFVDSTSGKVGIGTISPSYLLQVGSIADGKDVNLSGVLFVNGSSGRVGIGSTSPQYLLQVVSGTDGRSVNLSNVLFVNGSSGRVGIGTISPTSLLHVIGNVNLTRNLTVGDGNTTIEITTQNFNVSNGNLDLSGTIRAGGGLNLSGDTNISGNFYVTGNTVLGDSTSDAIAINAQFTSNLVPQANNVDLGSATLFWRRAYIDLATIGNLSAAGVDIGGTSSATFMLNSNYSGNDGRTIELIFERGTPTLNAVFSWDNTTKRFDMNFPLNIQANQNLTVDTSTLFVDGSIDKVGINTTTPSDTLSVNGTFRVVTGSGSQAMFINPAGNVGIGTTTPRGLLEISSGLNSTIINQNSITWINGTPSGNITLQAIANDDSFYSLVLSRNFSSESVRFRLRNDDVTASTGRAFVCYDAIDNGALGQFCQYGPNYNTAAFINFTKMSGDARGGGVLLRANDATGIIKFMTGGSNERMRIDRFGRVGINTTTPSDTLSVNGTLRVVTGSGSQAMFINPAGNVGINTTTPANTLTVQGTLNVTSQPTRSGDLFVASSGNVGIGTTSPSSVLQVAGTFNATSSSTQMLLDSNGDVTINLKG